MALVTGASGFLGRKVVASLRAHGHSVRALVRRLPDREGLADLGWDDRVEIVVCDLRSATDLDAALAGCDAVLHLAAAMSGGEVPRFTDTAIATERLFEAMERSGLRRLILCSSFSVYDWLSARGVADETLGVDPDPYGSGGYTTAKVWQERLARRRAVEHGWQLTILRPGFIWGGGNELPPASIGRSVGPLHFVFGVTRRPAFTHVENCADCFRVALESPGSVGQTINVVDGHRITAWRFLGEHLRRTRGGGVRVPVPYRVLAFVVAATRALSSGIFGDRAKLPSFFAAAEFAEIYRPLEHSTERRQRVLADHHPMPFEECLERTYLAVVPRT